MNKICIFFLVFCSLTSIAIKTTGQQFIENDTVWASDTVRIYNDIVVEYPATLTVNPGVYVEFQDNYSIDIYGKLIAIGSGKLPIIFTIADTNSFGDTATLAGGWGGMKFYNNTIDTSFLQYCVFKYGKAVDPGTYWEELSNNNHKGGAVFLDGYRNLFVNNCLFTNNHANAKGGAIYIKQGYQLVIRDCEFRNNTTYRWGGGVCVESCNNTPEISNNLFHSNIAFFVSVNGYVHGAGAGLSIHCNSIIKNNRFYNNQSTNGALYESSYNSLIFNNIFANNNANGMVIGGATFSISKVYNNTVVNNMSYVHMGTGVLAFAENLFLRNNIMFGNKTYHTGFTPFQFYLSNSSNQSDFAYSCNPDEAIYYQGEGNIQDDPQFVNPTPDAGPDYDGLSADWSLLDSSPCVNTGTPDTSGLNLPATDLRGNPRIYGIRIDMGAIENQTVVGLPENLFVNARVQVSPNPFGQSFKVISPGREKISSFRLFNQKGQQIGMETLMPMDQILVFDLGYQPPGLYLLVTRFEDGTSETTKLVKY
jgi:predicted outer membrane repeat protein